MTGRRAAAFLAAFMLPSLSCCADWILAAEPFSWQVDSPAAEAQAQAMSGQLPSLVLDALSGCGERVPSLQEAQNRRLAQLRAERPALVKALDAAVKNRDEVFLSAKSESEFDKAMAGKASLVDEARESLLENERQTKALLAEIETGEADSVYTVRPETVALWKGDPASLLRPAAGSSTEELAAAQKINALVTGRITVFGSYAMVQADLVIYPGGIPAGTVSETGSLSDVVSLAEGLARQLLPLIVNGGDVSVLFSVMPEEAARTAVVVMDGKILPLAEIPPDGLRIPAGEHSVAVEAEGFYAKSFAWDFSGAERFRATVRLEPRQLVRLSLSEEEGVPGRVYVDALPAGNSPVKTEVPQGLVLGEFVPDDGAAADSGKEARPSFFTLDVDSDGGLGQVNARLKAETEDISLRIEKRRRTMYNSYSALLVSLIPAVFSYGMHVNTHNAWALGFGDESTASAWRTVSYVSMGLSAVLGVNFVVQLGRYIASADDVLPGETDLDEE